MSDYAHVCIRIFIQCIQCIQSIQCIGKNICYKREVYVCKYTKIEVNLNRRVHAVSICTV